VTTTTERPPNVDYDVEQEVDFGRYVGSVLLRWWLPVAGLVVGALVGYVISLGASQVYRAQATIYLGQPYGGASSNVQIVSLQTNPQSVHQIVTAESVIQSIARRAGMRPRQLRGHISTSAVSTASNANRLTQAPLVTITVTGKAPAKVRTAANKLANVAVLKLGEFAKAKIAKLKEEIQYDDQQLAAIQKASGSGDAAAAAAFAVLRGQLQQDRVQTQVQLAQAQQVESPRIVTAAAPHKVTARSRRNTMAVAALIGLLLGIVAALLWEPVAGRFARG
jgi:capsular polysaccharide biosynthesis protein